MYGEVMCVAGDVVLEDYICDPREKPPPRSACNTFPCTTKADNNDTLAWSRKMINLSTNLQTNLG